jgi:protocatechuate 3,4-dioxygenase alpha subunit
MFPQKTLQQTPSQTVGPFFHGGLLIGGEHVLIESQTLGQPICIVGMVYDGAGQPVPDALIEIWQADAQGYFNHAADEQQSLADQHFRGFGRSGTNEHGQFLFQTVRPGPVAGREGAMQAPHISVRVFARGMLIHAVTRLYFPDENANATDAVLNAIDDPARRQTLIAVHEAAAGAPAYRFNIHLQGERETVFFEP